MDIAKDAQKLFTMNGCSFEGERLRIAGVCRTADGAAVFLSVRTESEMVMKDLLLENLPFGVTEVCAVYVTLVPLALCVSFQSWISCIFQRDIFTMVAAFACDPKKNCCLSHQ